MPGTPATTPRHGAPRYGDLDAADIGAIANSISDKFDTTAPVFGSGLLAARPSTGAGIADRYYYATDAVRPDGSTGVLYRDAGGASPTWSAVTPVAPGSTVTSLPGSPVDGQIIDYLADATNGIVWRFRYRAASASTYKWESLGGPPMQHEVSAAESRGASAVYGDITTVGPTLTIPLAGEYIFDFGALLQPASTVQAIAYAALSINGVVPANGANADSIASETPAAAASFNSGSRRLRRTITAALNAAKVMYATDGSTTAFYRNRFLMAMPVRVG